MLMSMPTDLDLDPGVELELVLGLELLVLALAAEDDPSTIATAKQRRPAATWRDELSGSPAHQRPPAVPNGRSRHLHREVEREERDHEHRGGEPGVVVARARPGRSTARRASRGDHARRRSSRPSCAGPPKRWRAAASHNLNRTLGDPRSAADEIAGDRQIRRRRKTGSADDEDDQVEVPKPPVIPPELPEFASGEFRPFQMSLNRRRQARTPRSRPEPRRRSRARRRSDERPHPEPRQRTGDDGPDQQRSGSGRTCHRRPGCRCCCCS